MAKSEGIINPVIPAELGQGSTQEGAQVVGKFVTSIIGAFLFIGFIFALLYLLLGAISWITSSGDKVKLEEARNKIIHAIVGLVILAGAWVIILFVGTWLGIDIKELPIPTVIN